MLMQGFFGLSLFEALHTPAARSAGVGVVSARRSGRQGCPALYPTLTPAAVKQLSECVGQNPDPSEVRCMEKVAISRR